MEGEESLGVYQCTFDFNAETEHDLPLRRGDFVKVTKRINADWFVGCTQNACGQFPANFVKTPFPNHDTVSRLGYAHTDFVAEQPGDLSLKKDDVVGIIAAVDHNWLSGCTQHDSGIFPASFLTEILFFKDNCSLDANNNKENDIRKYDQKSIWNPTSNTNDKVAKPMGRVVDAFQAQGDDEISINVGDEVQLTREIDSFWMEGILNQKRGKFPKMYIEVIRDLPPELKFIEKCVEPKSDVPVPKARALFMFIGTEPDDLSFDKGDTIFLTSRVNKNWLRGKVGKVEGKFPSSYVDIICDLPYSSNQIEVSSPQKQTSTNAPKQTNSPNVSKQQQNQQNLLEKKQSRQQQPVRTKVVASNIPAAPKIRAASSRSTSSMQSNPIFYQPTSTTENESASEGIEKPNKKMTAGDNIINQSPRKPSLKEKPVLQHQSDKSIKIKGKKQEYKNHSKTSEKKLSYPPTNSTHEKNQEPLTHLSPTHPPLEKRVSNGRKKHPLPPHNFELVEEKIFDMYSKPTPNPGVLPKRGSFKREGSAKPVFSSNDNNTNVNSSTNSNTNQNNRVDLLTSPTRSPSKNKPKLLPKPIAPLPGPPTVRPTSLVLNNNKSNMEHVHSPSSPSTIIHSQSFSVSYKKETHDRGVTLAKSGTDSQLSKHLLSSDPIINHRMESSQRSYRKNSVQRPKSMYFSSTTTPSPEKRSMTLDAVLQRSSSLRTSTNLKPDVSVRKMSSITPDTPAEGHIDSSEELKRIDHEIAELKSKIEAEAHLLSGVETLLDFVSEEKKADLYTKQDQHNANIVEMNEDLNALEDQKSYLLASLGEVDDVLHRVSELEKQIEMYLDNCEQLRRMQDATVVEELPEIRDSIEFCENMVDTLQDELNGLREKLGDMGRLETEEEKSGTEEEMVAKKRKNQMNVIEELIKTEKSYCNDITLLRETMKNMENMQEDTEINTEVLFGNLPDIVELSTKLLHLFDSINLEADRDDVLSGISTAFVDLSSEMKTCYATYCRNYDDAQSMKEKYEEDPITWNCIVNAINSSSANIEIFNLGSYLIKPVQRILKYPLLLSELYKNQVNANSSKEDLKKALDTCTDVATAINEFKRRKDLVLKYRENEDRIGKRVQKLNWHSVAKKSSRINQKITQFTGLNSQTVDDAFNEEEKKFRTLEKLIKTVLKNITQFVEEFKENSTFQKQYAGSLYEMFGGDGGSEEVTSYYQKICQITELYTEQMLSFIKEHVIEPLTQLLQLFPAPFRLIQKRNDKCLDYDRAKNKAQRARDSKEKDKISQTEQELQMCENVYTALNSQLLEELPSLTEKCSSFLFYCLQNFTEARKRYFTSSFSELHALWELPFINKKRDMFERHQELIEKASEQLTSLTFVPPVQNKDRRSSNAAGENPQKSKSPTSQPLIDLNEENDVAENDDIVVGDVTHVNNTGFTNMLIPERMLQFPITPPPPEPKSADQNLVLCRCVVKFDFQAENDSELSVLEGIVVNVLNKCDKSGNPEWWLVEYGGNQGYIPESFLENYELEKTQTESSRNEVVYNNSTNDTHYNLLPNTITLTSMNDKSRDLRNTKESIENLDGISCTSNENDSKSYYSEDSQSEKSSEISTDSTEIFYVLEYDFEALNTDELTAKEGQVVKCIHKHDQKGNAEWWLCEFDDQRGYIPRNYLSFYDNTQMC